MILREPNISIVEKHSGFYDYLMCITKTTTLFDVGY